MTTRHKLVNGVRVEMTEEEIGTLESNRASQAVKRAKTAYLKQRKKAYGTPEKQLDYIAQNGIDAFIAFRQAIDAQYTAPEES